jgi:hypothetical protein
MRTVELLHKLRAALENNTAWSKEVIRETVSSIVSEGDFTHADKDMAFEHLHYATTPINPSIYADLLKDSTTFDRQDVLRWVSFAADHAMADDGREITLDISIKMTIPRALIDRTHVGYEEENAESRLISMRYADEKWAKLIECKDDPKTHRFVWEALFGRDNHGLDIASKLEMTVQRATTK